MTGYQIPRNSLAWLLAAQVAVIAPHVVRLPIWVVAVCAGCIFWRVMVYQGRWNYPGRLVKISFVLGGTIGIPLGYRTVLGLEPAVALLVIAYALKLLEMHHKRDAYIVVLLGYFVAMTQFLFYQTISWTLFIFAAVTMITAGLIGLNQTRTHLRPTVTLKTAGLLVAQSLPLMIVLFILFPRVPPLWTVPMPSQVARTGVGDTLSPGDIASLTQSADLAFKVTFDGKVPPSSQLYWRGLVLSRFDGRTWTQEPGFARSPWTTGEEEPAWAGNIERLGRNVSYSVILEPTQRNWLFTLTVPDVPEERDLVLLRDFRLGSRESIRGKLRYQVESSLDYRLDPELSGYWRYRSLLVPEGSNPRTRELAAALFSESTDVEDYIRRVMRMYNLENFVYTLRPPLLESDNTIDEFMFESRRGFCEHFAGSFVFMMRVAGVPARVVVGYQGGEFNQFGDYLAVYQYDAHAWAEVWLEGRGWVRADPTNAVAPERIERGLEAAVEDEATFLADSPLSLWGRQTLWLADLRLQLSAIGYYWDSWVVGYTPTAQAAFLSRYLGKVDRKRMGMIMLGLFFGLLGVIAFFILMKRPNRALAPPDREYLRFCMALEKQGIARRIGEGPLDYADRVTRQRPDLRGPVSEVTGLYVHLNYGVADEPVDVGRLVRAVRSFRLRALVQAGRS
jgi:transglutaminase-like putative cysteine protease